MCIRDRNLGPNTSLTASLRALQVRYGLSDGRFSHKTVTEGTGNLRGAHATDDRPRGADREMPLVEGVLEGLLGGDEPLGHVPELVDGPTCPAMSL